MKKSKKTIIVESTEQESLHQAQHYEPGLKMGYELLREGSAEDKAEWNLEIARRTAFKKRVLANKFIELKGTAGRWFSPEVTKMIEALQSKMYSEIDMWAVSMYVKTG